MTVLAGASRGVFLDTGAFYAFADADDRHHDDARVIFSGLSGRGTHLYTTSWIVAETHALLLNRLNRRVATQYLRDTERGTHISVVWVSPRDVRRAREIIYQFEDKDFTLTDATSYAVMERLGITHAFTFDHHFSQYGFIVLSGDNL